MAEEPARLMPAEEDSNGESSWASAELPVPLSTLIGRERDIADATKLLLRPEVRIVTLTGPGGVGKTRISLEVARNARGQFSDGVFLVSLAPLTGPELVLAAVTRALNIPEIGDQPPSLRLRHELRDRQMLLVLDGFEHLVDAADGVADLLQSCPSVKAIVSSRSRLFIDGEHLQEVCPLDLPAPGASLTIPDLMVFSAPRLFIERCRQVRRDFAPSKSDATTIVEVCQRLDGLPLAIELAAARIRLMDPPALLAELAGGPRLFAAGTDRAESKQTIDATIKWSCDLLPLPEQALFRQLAIFSGSFSLAAAEAVAGSQTGQSVLNGIASLVNQSLLQRDESGDDVPRFRMLDTIRDFGIDALRHAGQLDETATRQASFFLWLAEHAEAELTGVDQGVWLDRLERDHDNLRFALDWSLGHDDAQSVERAARLAGALRVFWFIHGHIAEGRTRLNGILCRPGVSDSSLAKALAGAGLLAEAQGDYLQAETLLDHSLALYENLEDDRGCATALLFRGLVAFDQHSDDLAAAFCRQSVERARPCGAAWVTAVALAQLGMVSMKTGDHEEARHLIRDSLALFEELGNPWGIALSRGNLGVVALDRGETEDALTSLRQSLRLFLELRDVWGIVNYLDACARALTAIGQEARGARLFGAATELGTRFGVATKAVFRGGFEQNVERVRHALGENEFIAAWAAGTAMTLDDAVAEALATAPPTAVGPATVGISTMGIPFGLTAREVDVLHYLAEGLSDREIGDVLFIGHRTVATHVGHILSKFDVRSRAAAAAFAVRHQII